MQVSFFIANFAGTKVYYPYRTQNKTSMLDIKDLGIRFGKESLFRHIDLQVKPGEVVCLTGPSGCGKTTLLKAVMGFVLPFEGSIAVDKIQLSPRTADTIRRRVAWMPQGLSLPTEWVREMIQLPFLLRVNKGIHFSEEKLLDYFDRLGLEKEILDKRLHEISGGQHQRILLAITAMQEKPLVITDEPTSALDHNSTEKALQFIRHLAEKEQRAVLAVSHEKRFIQGCDREFIIKKQEVGN